MARKIEIRLQERASGREITVFYLCRNKRPIWDYHQRALNANPGCFIRKSIWH